MFCAAFLANLSNSLSYIKNFLYVSCLGNFLYRKFINRKFPMYFSSVFSAVLHHLFIQYICRNFPI